ncbi:MAG: hypothetical protein AM326_01790 [Candidatus Thorarchaeota archaeon SMTZ-45]|nr:MAG: hypothetical protein AM326_01790 [Candidatus Thorarchaeota archaeon SMTZ-45]
MEEQLKPINEIVEEFIEDENSIGISDLTLDQKMDLMVYQLYKIGYRLQLVHGILILFVIAIIGLRIIDFFWG